MHKKSTGAKSVKNQLPYTVSFIAPQQSKSVPSSSVQKTKESSQSLFVAAGL